MNYLPNIVSIQAGRQVFYDLSQTVEGRNKLSHALKVADGLPIILMISGIVNELFVDSEDRKVAEQYLVHKSIISRDSKQVGPYHKIKTAFQKMALGQFKSNVVKYGPAPLTPPSGYQYGILGQGQRLIEDDPVKSDEDGASVELNGSEDEYADINNEPLFPFNEKIAPRPFLNESDVSATDYLIEGESSDSETEPGTPVLNVTPLLPETFPLNEGLEYLKERPLNTGLPLVQPDDIGRQRPSPSQENIPQYVEEADALEPQTVSEPETKPKRSFLSRFFSTISQWISRLLEWIKTLFS